MTYKVSIRCLMVLKENKSNFFVSKLPIDDDIEVYHYSLENTTIEKAILFIDKISKTKSIDKVIISYNSEVSHGSREN